MMGKYENLYEGIDLSNYNPQQIMNGKKIYDYIVESANLAKETNTSIDDNIDEGILGALIGAAAGATVAPSIMKSICKVLGISENGVLGSLLTSRTVLMAMCADLCLRM